MSLRGWMLAAAAVAGALWLGWPMITQLPGASSIFGGTTRVITVNPNWGGR